MATKDTNADLIEQFKAGMTPESATAIVDRITKAEAELAELKARPDQTADLAAANERADKAEADLAKANAEREAAEAKLAEAEKARDAAQEEVQAIQLDAPAKPRRIAVTKDFARDPEETPEEFRDRRSKLKGDIADADLVEIAFGDGTKEILGLPPVEIRGNAWAEHIGGLVLSQPIDLYGPATGQASFEVSTIALFLDGELRDVVRQDPITVPAGGHVKLENSIIF